MWTSEGYNSLAVVIVSLSTATAGLILFYELYQALFRSKRLPPGPLLHFPFLGDGFFLGIGNPLAFLFSRLKRYGPIYRLKMLGATVWMLNDPILLRPLLKDENAEPLIPISTFEALMGDGTLLRSHPSGAHPAWRKVFLAAVAPPQLAALVPRVLGVMRSHLDSWEAAGRVPIYRAARKMGVDLAVDVIVQVPGGIDRELFKKQVETFYDGLYTLHIPLPGTAFSRAKAAKAWLLDALEPAIKELHAETMKQLDAVGRSVPAYAAKLLEQQATAADAPQPPPPPAPSKEAAAVAGGAGAAGATGAAAAAGPASSGYDPALAQEPSIPVAQILQRAATNRYELREAALGILHMLVGSGDTTRFALFNVWALVAGSPRVQDRIHEEQQQVISQYGEDLSYQATCSMPYLDATLKECLRLLPASGGSMRRLTEDMQMGKYVIPKGDVVWYNAALLHATDPALWDGNTDCEVPPHMDWRGNLEAAFRPERWLAGGGEEGGRPRNYYTFGSGVHLCAGMNLVYMELKLLLALVLRKYRLKLETPDMLRRCDRLFPFLVPAKGTDNVLLVPREAPAQAA